MLDKELRDIAAISEFQFGFVPGKGTSFATFIVRQLQEKYLAKEHNVYFAFVDLFDCIPRDIIWWALRCIGIPE